MIENVQAQGVCPDCGLRVSVLTQIPGQNECPKCGRKFVPAPTSVGAASSVPGSDPEPEQTRPKSSRSTKDIDWTQTRLAPARRKTPMAWPAALGVTGVALIFALLLLLRSRPGSAKASALSGPDASALPVPSPVPAAQPASPSQHGIPSFPTPPASLPAARVKRAKSLNDFRFGEFVVSPRRPGDDFMAISGDIENVSDNLHRHVRIELDLLDAQGLKIAGMNDVVTELAPHTTWHVILRTTNPRSAAVRLAGIREEP